MNPCRIAVGSTRRPKLQAVQEAAASFGAKLTPHGPLEIQGYEVESGVSHTPSSREELMQGARQRAEALHKMLADSGQRADYCLGLEGASTSPLKTAPAASFSKAGLTLPMASADISAARGA